MKHFIEQFYYGNIEPQERSTPQPTTIRKTEALELFEQWAFDDLERIAQELRRLMKTDIWRKRPAIFDWAIDKAFGEEAGF